MPQLPERESAISGRDGQTAVSRKLTGGFQTWLGYFRDDPGIKNRGHKLGSQR